MLQWAVYFIVISNMFRQLGTVAIAGFTINQSVIILTFLTAFPAKLFRRQRLIEIDVLDIALIAFGIYLWISNYLVNQDPSWGGRVSDNYLRSLICYFLVVFVITDRRKFYYFVMTYIISSLAMIFTANLLSVFQSGISFTLHSRDRKSVV